MHILTKFSISETKNRTVPNENEYNMRYIIAKN